jgi:ribosomal protein S27AE
VSYRDEQQALLVEVAALTRENEQLKVALLESEARFKALLSHEYEQRLKSVRKKCVMCSGNLLPVAIVAGHDIRNPLPLKMSTLRFGSPEGGFTASAPVRSYACGTCGYIHNFIDMEQVGP